MMFEWVFTIENGDWEKATGTVKPTKARRHADVNAGIVSIDYYSDSWEVTIVALGESREVALADAKKVFERDAPDDMKQYLRERYR